MKNKKIISTFKSNKEVILSTSIQLNTTQSLKLSLSIVLFNDLITYLNKLNVTCLHGDIWVIWNGDLIFFIVNVIKNISTNGKIHNKLYFC